MMVEKAAWISGENDFSMSMNVCKVDQEQRMVHGWATLDNPDRQGDIVEATASEKAFSRFRGNIREMHEKIAAGRMVSYRPQVFVDDEGNSFNGVFVSAYVSKGAASTWEKVLDGTLNAFSIKGPVYDYEVRYNEKLGKSLRHILDYDLEELSLVDSGGNQLANVVSIQKNDTGEVEVSGMYEDVTVENIFLCTEDKVAEVSSEETLKCQNGHKMENIGWVEASGSKSEAVSKAVDEYFNKKSIEGGVEEMAEENIVEKAADVNEAEAVIADNAVVAEPEVPATPENVAEAEENQETVVAEEEQEEDEHKDAADAAFDVEKAFASLTDSITALTDKIAEGFTTLAGDVNKRLDEVEEKTTEKISEVTKTVDDVKEELGEVSKSVDGLEDETALKKSGDLGGSNEPVKKAGVWAGSIL